MEELFTLQNIEKLKLRQLDTNFPLSIRIQNLQRLDQTGNFLKKATKNFSIYLGTS